MIWYNIEKAAEISDKSKRTIRLRLQGLKELLSEIQLSHIMRYKTDNDGVERLYVSEIFINEHVNTAKDTWIYFLIDPRCGSVRYIGKTKNLEIRKGNHLGKNSHSKKLRLWKDELDVLGLKPIFIKVAKFNCGEAFLQENFLIKEFKEKGILNTIYNKIAANYV